MELGTRRLVVGLALIALLLPFFAGCGGGSAVSQANFDKVKIGMTQTEVEAILGKGADKVAVAVPSVEVGGVAVSVPTTKVVEWKDGTKVITVTFLDGKVSIKAPSGL